MTSSLTMFKGYSLNKNIRQAKNLGTGEIRVSKTGPEQEEQRIFVKSGKKGKCRVLLECHLAKGSRRVSLEKSLDVCFDLKSLCCPNGVS